MNLKKYLPVENYVMTSKLSVEDVKKRLADNIQPKGPIRLSAFNRNTDKLYEGHIFGDTFTISRIINYRNSFLPVITGQVSTVQGKTQINVKMSPVPVVLVFISIWLGIIGLVCLGVILVGLIQFKQVLQNGFSPMILIPFGMLIFGCLLTNRAFKAESKISKEFLNRILEGHESL
jgi:hypothetical protein